VAQTKVDPDLDPGIDGNSRGATKAKMQSAVSPGKRKAWVDAILKGGIDPHVHSGRAEGIAGVPVVAGAFSGIHVIAVWSYLYPGAFFNASFVVFMTGYHLLLSLVLNWTELKGTATSLSEPKRRKEPTAARRRGSSAADLQKQLEQRTRELAEALEHQTATAEVLRGKSSAIEALTRRLNACLPPQCAFSHHGHHQSVETSTRNQRFEPRGIRANRF